MNSTTASAPRLSICIATYMRGAFIERTLRSMMPQLDDRCELVIVDGASPDNTAAAVRAAVGTDEKVRYFREDVNSGVDRDYDKAVGYARGDYCWLMTDDDMLAPDAVRKVVAALESDTDVVVVNSEVRSVDLARPLKPNLLPLDGPSSYGKDDIEALFSEVGKYLSFIGGLVIKRSLWLARQRVPYCGSLFIHIGVLFQEPLISSARIVREPLIAIRYGNAMWTSRTFEIWMFKWPELIWSFDHLAESTRRSVSSRTPHRSAKNLLWYRGTGGYSVSEYERYLRGRERGMRLLLPWIVARTPATIANALCGMYCWLRIFRPARMAVYDLARAKSSAALSRKLSQRLRLQ